MINDIRVAAEQVRDERTVDQNTAQRVGDCLVKITDALSQKVDKKGGKGLSTNDYTTEEKALVGTIPGIANKAEGAFTRVTTEMKRTAFIAEFSDKAGTIQQYIRIPSATSSGAGIMTAEDKKKLDRCPDESSLAHLTTALAGKIQNIKLVLGGNNKLDIVAERNNADNITLNLPIVSTTQAGLMRAHDKKKLDANAAILQELITIVNDIESRLRALEAATSSELNQH